MSTSSANNVGPTPAPSSASSAANHDAPLTPLSSIDGSRGEGGGQVLRNAVAYAALLRRPVEIANVRAGRSRPGLRPQHSTGLRLIRDIAGGALHGDHVGSCAVRYDADDDGGGHDDDGADSSEVDGGGGSGSKKRRRPRATKEEGREIIVGDTGTAGSICLLLQAALPCALFAAANRTSSSLPVELELRGGTNASNAPQIDYLTRVFLPVAVAGFGLPEGITIDVLRRGYFPRGGGIVRVTVPPMRGKLKPIKLIERGEVTQVRVRVFHAGKCPRSIAEKIADGALKELSSSASSSPLPENLRPAMEIVRESDALDSASGILVVAHTNTGCLFGGSALGSPKVSPYETGREAASEVLEAVRSGGCVDSWLQDQVVLYMALAEGVSEMVVGCVTLHARTAIEIAERMTDAKFEVTQLTGGGDSTASNSEAEKNDGNVVNAAPSMYGSKGLTRGRHMIRCHGIGHFRKALDST